MATEMAAKETAVRSVAVRAEMVPTMTMEKWLSLPRHESSSPSPGPSSGSGIGVLVWFVPGEIVGSATELLPSPEGGMVGEVVMD